MTVVARVTFAVVVVVAIAAAAAAPPSVQNLADADAILARYCERQAKVYWPNRGVCVSPSAYQAVLPRPRPSVGFDSNHPPDSIILPRYTVRVNERDPLNATIDLYYADNEDNLITESVSCMRGFHVDRRYVKCTPDQPSEFVQTTLGLEAELSDKASRRKVICYVSNWSQYHSKFLSHHVPTDLCSHVMYAFFPLNDAGEVKLSDGWADISPQLNTIKKMVALRGKGIVEHVIMSIGGWTYSGPERRTWFDIDDLNYRVHTNQKTFQEIWLEMMSSAANRAVFIKSIDRMVQTFKFDGVELDLEYPGCPQGVCSTHFGPEKENFYLLLKELRDYFGPNFHLSIASSANTGVVTASGPDMLAVSNVVNFISVMTYDYYVYTGASGRMGHNQPKSNVTASVDYYVNRLKIDPAKILIGVSLYGRGYKLNRQTLTKAIVENRFDGNGPVIGPSSAFPLSQQASVGTLRELCLLPRCDRDTFRNTYQSSLSSSDSPTTTTTIIDTLISAFSLVKTKNVKTLARFFDALDSLQKSSSSSFSSQSRCIYNSFFDESDKSSWLVLDQDNSAIAYTDVNDMRELRNLAEKYNLGGYLVYAVDQEDFDGSCRLPGGSFPFLRALITGERLPSSSGDVKANLLYNDKLNSGGGGSGNEGGSEGGSGNGGGSEGGSGNGGGSEGGSGNGGGSEGGNEGGSGNGGSEGSDCVSSKCAITGFGRDLCNCHNYFQCIGGGGNGQVIKYPMSCPNDLVFNEDANVCDWITNVDVSGIPCNT